MLNLLLIPILLLIFQMDKDKVKHKEKFKFTFKGNFQQSSYTPFKVYELGVLHDE